MVCIYGLDFGVSVGGLVNMWYHAGGGGGLVGSLAMVYLLCWLRLTEQGYCDTETEKKKRMFVQGEGI
jgi:hypothetical protein